MTIRRVPKLRSGTVDVRSRYGKHDAPVFGVRRQRSGHSDANSESASTNSSEGFAHLRRPATTHIGGWRTNKSSVQGLRRSSPRSGPPLSPTTAPPSFQTSPMIPIIPPSYAGSVATPGTMTPDGSLQIPHSVLKRMAELEQGQKEAEAKLAEAERELKQIELREQYFENLRRRGIEPPVERKSVKNEPPPSAVISQIRHITAPSSSTVMAGQSPIRPSSSVIPPPTLAGSSAIPGSSAIRGSSAIPGSSAIMGSSAIPGSSAIRASTAIANPTYQYMKDLTPPNLPSSCFSDSTSNHSSSKATSSIPAGAGSTALSYQAPSQPFSESQGTHILPTSLIQIPPAAPPPPQQYQYQQMSPPASLYRHTSTRPSLPPTYQQRASYPTPTPMQPPRSMYAQRPMPQVVNTPVPPQQMLPRLSYAPVRPVHANVYPVRPSRPVPAPAPAFTRQQVAPAPVAFPPHQPQPQQQRLSYSSSAYAVAPTYSSHAAYPSQTRQPWFNPSQIPPSIRERSYPVQQAEPYPVPLRPVPITPRPSVSPRPTPVNLQRRHPDDMPQILSPRHRAIISGIEPPLVTVGGMQLPEGAEVTPNSEGFMTIERTQAPSVGSKKKKRSCGC